VAHIQVHADALHRSLLILQALINEGERRGYRAVVGEHCKGLCLTISGHNVELVLTEESKRIPHELTSLRPSSGRGDTATATAFPTGTTFPLAVLFSVMTTAAMGPQ